MSFHKMKVTTTMLSAGVRTCFTEFETATRRHEQQLERIKEGERFSAEDILRINTAFQRKKQQLLRKLWRMQQGPNEANIEQMKRDLRKLSKAYVTIAGESERKLFPNEWNLADEIARGRRIM